MPEKRAGVFGFGLSNLSSEIGDNEAKYALVKDVCAAFTLDEVMKTLSIKRLDFMKNDIEGFELNMLQGARQTRIDFKPPVYIEVNDGSLKRVGASREMIWAFFNDIGYKPYQLKTKEKKLVKLDLNTPQGGGILWSRESKNLT